MATTNAVSNARKKTHHSAAAVASKAGDGAAVGLHAVEREVFLGDALLLHLRQVPLAHLKKLTITAR